MLYAGASGARLGPGAGHGSWGQGLRVDSVPLWTGTGTRIPRGVGSEWGAAALWQRVHGGTTQQVYLGYMPRPLGPPPPHPCFSQALLRASEAFLQDHSVLELRTTGLLSLIWEVGDWGETGSRDAHQPCPVFPRRHSWRQPGPRGCATCWWFPRGNLRARMRRSSWGWISQTTGGSRGGGGRGAGT